MKFGAFVVFGLLVATCSGAQLDQEWLQFKQRYGKRYGTRAEEKSRFEIYSQNKGRVEEHNRKARDGKFSFTLALNRYADLLHQEFVQILQLGKRVAHKNIAGQPYRSSRPLDTPVAVDWRARGCVRGPIDQQLGCSYPSVATGALEGQRCANHDALTPISEQNLLDCVGNCQNGSVDAAFHYCVTNGGVDTEASYPYTGAQNGTCRYQRDTRGVQCNSVVDIPKGNESLLRQAIGSEGPVSVAIDASHASFQFYANGVYYEANCSCVFVDHLLLVVGYDSTNDGQDYWIARNSWGTSWGQNGYVLLSRNRDNNCGVATVASYPRTAVVTTATNL